MYQFTIKWTFHQRKRIWNSIQSKYELEIMLNRTIFETYLQITNFFLWK